MATNTHSAQFVRASNQSLSVASAMGISMTTAHSYVFWLKFPSNPTLNNNYYCLFHSISGHAEELFIYENIAGTMTPIYRRANNVTGVNASTVQDLSGAWHHIAMVNDTTNCILYIDGTSVGSVATLADGNAGDPNLFNLGSNAVGGTQGLDGFMDDVRVYNVALSSGQVSALFSSPSNVVNGLTNLTAGYDFNSSLTTDVTGNFGLSNNSSVTQSTDVPFSGVSGTQSGFFLNFI